MFGFYIRIVIQKQHQNQNKNVSLSTKLRICNGHPNPWPEPYRRWLGWTEKKKHQQGSGEILYGGMVSDLLSVVLQTHQALWKKAQSFYLGKRRLQKVFNKRGQIIVPKVFWRKTFLFHIVISPHFQLFNFNERLAFCIYIQYIYTQYY